MNACATVCWPLYVLCVLQSGTKEDLDSISHLPSDPREGSLLASLDAYCTTQAGLQLVRCILEMSKEIHEIRQDILSVKATQQQLLRAISNVESHLQCTTQQLPPAQWQRVAELGSSESVYYSCPRSRENSKGDHDLLIGQHGRRRCNTQPPATLNLQVDSKQPHVDQKTSPNSKNGKLDYVADKSTDRELSTKVRHQTCMHLSAVQKGIAIVHMLWHYIAIWFYILYVCITTFMPSQCFTYH